MPNQSTKASTNISTIIFATLVVILFFGAGSYRLWYKITDDHQELRAELKLKAPKEDIVDFKYSNNNPNSNLVSYRYISNQEVPPTVYQGLKEDISKRTTNSQTFLKSITKISATKQKEEYVSKFYSGTKFQKKNSRWYEVKTATTTKTAFYSQTRLTLLDQVKFVFGQKVLADTFYAAVPNNAGDGNVSREYNSNYATQHDAATGTSVNNIYTFFSASAYGSTNNINRAFIPFDTSSLPDDITVTSATLRIYGSSVDDTPSLDCGFVTIVQTTQASETNLITEDYDQCGAVSNPTEGVDTGNRKDLTDFTTGLTWAEFTLNSTGRSWISKTSYTKLGVRIGCDALNIDPEGSREIFNMSSSESDYDPELVVNYSTTGILKINGGTLKINGGTLRLN